MASQAKLGLGPDALSLWAAEAGFHSQDIQHAIAHVKNLGLFQFNSCKALELAEKGHWDLQQARCLVWMKTPQLALFDQLLTQNEAEEIIKFSTTGLTDSLVSTPEPSVSSDRLSQSKTIFDHQCPAIIQLRNRLAQLLGIGLERFEPTQITRYQTGGHYAPHHDHFQQGHPRHTGPARRVATFIVYLHSPTEGGQTAIEPLGLRFAPARGHGLYFAYPDDQSKELTLHASVPCLGEKWIATHWIIAGD